MPKGLLLILSLTWIALAIGSGWRYFSVSRQRRRAQVPPSLALMAEPTLASLPVWWLLLLLCSLAAWLGPVGLAILFCAASLFGMVEFQQMFARRGTPVRGVMAAVISLTIVHYLLLPWIAPSQLLPVSALGLMLSNIIVQLYLGNTQDYVRTTAGYCWAACVIVICLSCAVALASLPATPSEWGAGAVGWTVYLILLTQTSDIAQALVGRRWGRHKLIPRVSPGKSWEGLLAGVLVCTVLAWGLAYPLTNFPEGRSFWETAVVSLTAGGLVALFGFLGDINISALKREAQVKDSSQLLPGMGGLLDRLDSLMLSAPVLYLYASVLAG